MTRPAALAALLIATVAAFAQADAERKPTLTVTGQGEIQAAPDRAILSFGAVAESEEASEAQADVNKIMADAIKQVTRLDIPDQKISTSNLSLQPMYEQRRPTPQADGSVKYEAPQISHYRASYTLSVIVDDIEKVGDVIDAVLESGINQFQGIQFTLQDDSEARNQALTRAAADAKSKAQTIAAAMNVQLGPIQTISESSGYRPMPVAYAARHMAMEADAATPIQAGELTINATINVEYTISESE